MIEMGDRKDAGVEDLVGHIADEFTERLNRGEDPDVEEYCERHPEVAVLLRQALPALQVVGQLASGSGSDKLVEDSLVPVTGTLGDYHIIREIGRGGMGVVYEAEQISLGRHVALKVLPFAAAMDSKQLRRFKNEAQAAALLHHQNIVPIHAVGCDRGVHYYAMQFIEGQSLAAVVQQMRGEKSEVRTQKSEVKNLKSEVRAAFYRDPHGSARESAQATSDTIRNAAGRDTVRSTKSPAYLRTVAHLGVQAAEALEHAHSQGIVHRDIKPANLLLDPQGNLWIADFGLAQSLKDGGLTMTGDVLGTVRYMSPEQASGQRTRVDHRTDIYSLGVTLYELLTLEPACPGPSREEILRQIAIEEPRALRRLNPAIPGEMETIVLKAISKNPGDRYATAQELADDLRRFLKDEPIRARRPNLVQRTRKWARRHQSVVVTAAVGVFLALAVLAGSIGWFLRDQAAREAVVQKDKELRQARAEQAVELALQDAFQYQAQGRWAEALAAANRAEVLLQSQDGNDDQRQRTRQLLAELARAEEKDKSLRQAKVAQAAEQALQDALQSQKQARWSVAVAAAKRAEALLQSQDGNEAQRRRTRELLADLTMDEKLEEIRLDCCSMSDWKYDFPNADPKLAQAFRELGIDIEILQIDEAAALIRARSIQSDLVMALDYWAWIQRTVADKVEGSKKLKKLLAIARLADPDPWRNRLRDAFEKGDGRMLKELAASERSVQLPPATLFVFGRALDSVGAINDAVTLLRKAHRRYPGDFWINNLLSYCLCRTKPAAFEDAIAHSKAALAIRSQSPWSYLALADALMKKGSLEEAIGYLNQALLIKPSFQAHNQLGLAWTDKGDIEKALAAFNEAIHLKPDSAEVWNNIGRAFFKKGSISAAIAGFRKAIDLDQRQASAHTNLGCALCRQGELDEGIKACTIAIQLQPNRPDFHCNLGALLGVKGASKEALAEFERAIFLDPDLAMAHYNVGCCILRSNLEVDRAITAYKEAIRIQRTMDRAHFGLGLALLKKRDPKQAVAAFQEAIRIKTDYPPAHFRLGMALSELGQFTDAADEFREAIRLKGNYASAHYQLGISLLHTGSIFEAQAAFQRWQELVQKPIRAKPEKDEEKDMPKPRDSLHTVFNQ